MPPPAGGSITTVLSPRGSWVAAGDVNHLRRLSRGAAILRLRGKVWDDAPCVRGAVAGSVPYSYT